MTRGGSAPGRMQGIRRARATLLVMKIELLYVDGVDIDPGVGARSDYGLKCRLYPTEQGLLGAPPDEWVLDALRHPGRPAG